MQVLLNEPHCYFDGPVISIPIAIRIGMTKKKAGTPLAYPLFKIYQPVSRILYPAKAGWLSFIWLQHYCYNLAAYPPASDEPPSIAGICGITAHKVYPINALLQKPVSSYLTFSSLLPPCHNRTYRIMPGEER